uniref:Uncharacterized protein n=1 Tax=Fagus sylvatica TaxID=28930 RepID=A0A2N9HWW9_FAGSY
MRGGRVGFIENRARLAQHHHARRMTVLRELWYCHVAVLSFHASSSLESSSISVRVPFFIRFSGAVLEVFRNSKWVMRHIVGKLSTSSFQRYKVCANRSSDEGVMAPGSRGVGAVFVHFSDADSGQTGDAIGEPRVPRRSRSHYLSNAPGLADQLVASRKDSAREGGSCAAYFCKVPDSRESELGLVRYGPASRVHRGVFGPFEGSFPIRIPADPDKFLAIREFHVVHGCVLFPMCPGSQINLLRVRKTLCASVATSALHRGEFGFARYDLANGGRRNVPYAKGIRGDEPSSEQADLVRAASFCVPTPEKIPGGLEKIGRDAKRSHYFRPRAAFPLHFVVFFPFSLSGPHFAPLHSFAHILLSGTPIDVPSSPTRSTRLRSTISFRLYVLQTWLGNPSKRSGTNWDLTLSRIAIGPGLGNLSKRSGTNWDLTLSRIAIGPGLGNSSKRSGTNWDLTLSRIAIGCLTEAVVAEIIAGPHLPLLGFVADGGIPCGPFLRDFGSVCFRCHASFIEVVVALFVGSECTCIPYFRLSYLIGRHFLKLRSVRLNLQLFQLIPDGGSISLISGLSSNFSVRGKIAPVWYNKINEFLILRASIPSPIWEILQEVSIRLDDVDLQ